ncbi:MAG: ATP-binding cassette domain-containing protein, partial [Lachnospiraceae bacterium]|nr:ATP-binding cassette domain-containing protein [Lachnospiraceae bacterium]
MDDKDVILKLNNVSKSFLLRSGERLEVIDNMSLSFPLGQLVIIKGRSGSGKTTLLNIMGALDNDYSGEVIFDGRNLNTLKEEEREKIRRCEMGFVFQSVALIPIMTAYENVDFALRTVGMTDDREDKIKEALELVGLSDRATHFPFQLSGGE